MAYLVISIGLFFILTGIVGIYRFNDSLLRMHACCVLEVAGICITLMGVALYMYPQFCTSKIMLLALVVFIISPVSSFMIGNLFYNKAK